MGSPRLITSLALAATLIALAATAHADEHAAAAAGGAPTLFNDRGSYHMAISTKAPEAQRWFDQGMRLMFGFNLEEAERAFERAEQLDSTCAMCAWGTAFSLGPHINYPATPDRTVKAHAAEQRALRHVANANPRERALIEAMSHRYADPAPADPAAQAALDSTYAAAMHDVMRKYPDDADVCVLWADAEMDVHPWDLYTPDGAPKPWTPDIVAALEHALAKAPDHVGANHLYIHAVEASTHPERALASADRIATMSPGEGHLVHMPSHIYHRVGQYERSCDANRKAILADERYRKAVNPQGFYLMYSAHNHQFLMWSCWMSGRYEESIREARAMLDIVPLDMLRQIPGMDFTIEYPAWTFIRFGRWQDALNEPAPPSDFAYARGAWHAARAIAEAKLGHLPEAQADRDSAVALAAVLPAEAPEGFNGARTLMSIAIDMASGVIMAKEGSTDLAVKTLTHAVATEDNLRYDEPADWYMPARHALGAVLLDAGRAADAQAVYETDLARNPANPWALAGLTASLKAQHKGKDATVAEARTLKAMKNADVKIGASWY